jgi:glycosyltransferase involved in cell wall biosynthesis
MAPLFAALFGPVAKARGIPILLWYAHGAVSPTLRVAHAFADRCVTSTPAGFRLPSDKLYAVGQGVDTEVFQPPGEELPDYDQTLISIGRLSRTKRIDEILAAMALLRDRGCDARLELTGEPLTEADREHVRDLEEQVDRLGLAATVRFTGRVRFDEVPARYHRGGVFINMSENRSIDKAILEAMASGCVPLSRNEAFGEIAAAHEIDELVPGPGPADIADAVERELSRPADDREWLRAQLRSIVVDGHSLDALADRLVGHLVELTR